MPTIYEIGKSYNFETHTTNMLPTSFKNAMVVAIANWQTASREMDVARLHAAVYPHLPEGIPDSHKAYSYIGVKTPIMLNPIYLGIPWIKEDTVEDVSGGEIMVVIKNVSPTKVSQIRDALVQNGFNELEITVTAGEPEIPG